MPRPVVLMFPGQASQYVGMGKDLYENSDAARDVMDTVTQIEGLGAVRDLCFDGPGDLLTRTDNVQPAITTISLMALAAVKEMAADHDVPFRYVACAGHSLGEYSAHAAAENLSLIQAINLVQWRGVWMNQASQPPNPSGTMVAVMGLSFEQVKDVVLQEGSNKVGVANINSPGQIILSGEGNSVTRCSELAKEAGAKKCILLNVSGAWHSPLMKPAQKKMEKLLDKEITEANNNISNTIPVIANVSAEVVGSLQEMRSTLSRQITSPVRWVECIRQLLAICGFPDLPSSLDEENGDTEHLPLFVEVGPGKVLKGLLRSIDRKLTVMNVEDIDSATKLMALLN